MLDLPPELQELFQQIPEDFEHGAHLFLRKDDCLSSRKSSSGYRYWLANTGEEVFVNWHSFDGRIGILTAQWDSLPGPVILGRDPSYTRQGFKPWKGVEVGFGSNGDDRNLVVKAQGQPDWVDQVRYRGASFDSLQINFTPADPGVVISRPWAICNTIRKLFSQALVHRMISRADSMTGLRVVVGGGDGSVETFDIAEGDDYTFESLEAGLKQVVGDWGLKGMTVEVSRI